MQGRFSLSLQRIKKLSMLGCHTGVVREFNILVPICRNFGGYDSISKDGY
jgi:hypothetical protein